MVGDDYLKFRNRVKCDINKIVDSTTKIKWKDYISKTRVENILISANGLLEEIKKLEIKDINSSKEDQRR